MNINHEMYPVKGSGGALQAPPAVSRAEPRPQKQFWHIWSPGKASDGKDLGFSCALNFFQNSP